MLLFDVSLGISACLGFVLLLVWLYQRFSRFFKILYKIPGPSGYPIFGHFTDLAVSPELLFKNERKWRSQHPLIYKLWLFNEGAVSIFDPRDIEVILSNSKFNKKARIYDLLHIWLNNGLLTSDGTKWKSRRKLLTPAFHFNILKEFIGIFNESTQQLLETLQSTTEKDSLNIIPLITELTLVTIAETSMGTKLDSSLEINRNYRKAVHDFGTVAIQRMARPWLYNPLIFHLSLTGMVTRKIVKTLHQFTRNVIESRKERFYSNSKGMSYTTKKRLAMLDLLLEVQKNGNDITNEGIREEVDTFMFEGHDTTSAALCFILLTLANHTSIQEEIRKEIIEVMGEDLDVVPAYHHLQELVFTERCIKECLRLYPSVPHIARHATEDVTIPTGYTIPKGAMIFVQIFDLHRDSRLYPDPERFDPDRFLPNNIEKRHPFAYLPFSAGPRNCIGQKFAMLELKAVLCGLLRKFYLEPVTKPEDMFFVKDLILRAGTEINIRFKNVR